MSTGCVAFTAPGVFVRTNALRLEASEIADGFPENDSGRVFDFSRSTAADAADRFRGLTVWLIAVGAMISLVLATSFRVRVATDGTPVLDGAMAALLVVSRMWWGRSEHQGLADASGTVGVVALGGMASGAFAMLELWLHFPIADQMLRGWDLR